jgi:formamidopyrimidine-DNA glycosylase
MPELPEVEILGRHLDRVLRDRRLGGVRRWEPGRRSPPDRGAFEALVSGRAVRSVSRRGKYLCVGLEPVSVSVSPVQDPAPGTGGWEGFLVHLGMTGRVDVLPADRPRGPHERVVIGLMDSGEEWVFRDTRRLGGISMDMGLLDRLGVEPLTPEFTPKLLHARLRESGQPLKVRLMDGAVVAGLGNIYAVEALNRAGLSPFLPSDECAAPACQRLHVAIRAVLQEALDRGAMASLDWVGQGTGRTTAGKHRKLFYFGAADGGDGSGSDGEEREVFRVYDREGDPCPACGGVIRRDRQQGRSTYWCPCCQRA